MGPFVIDTFFVRTADNSVRHHDGPSSGCVGEREHFFCYAGIIADIGPFGEPASKVVASASAAGTMPTVSLVALVSSGPYSATVATGWPRSPLLVLMALLCGRFRARSLICLLSRVDDPLAALGHRAQIFYRSRTVPRPSAWTEAMLSQPLACVLAAS